MTVETAKSGPIVAFIGPTLSPAEARTVLDAVYLPPAAQGSFLLAVDRYEPRAILLIDGTFQGEPAVRHKEILWALAQSIPVIGAASMGALRAAELFPHVRGVGLVYRWYRRFSFAPDDAVAVLHGPPEVNSAALTLAEIDLRMTFRAAERRGLVSRYVREKLEAAARRLNFRDRTLERIVAEAAPQLPLAAEWVNVLKTELVEQKKRDALLALRLLASGALASPTAPFDFVTTEAFMRDVEQTRVNIQGEETQA